MLCLYSITIFLSAYLLFVIEPIVAKAFLPLLGGTPAVWNTSMLFFQLSLLLGYLWAHLISRERRHTWLGNFHIAMLFLVCLIPISLELTVKVGQIRHPILWLLFNLTASIGPAFLFLSATSPLMQGWFSTLEHKYADNPYPLYAASNLGSLLALLSYPVLVEPFLDLKDQLLIWRIAFAALTVLMACLYLLGRAQFQKHALSAEKSDSFEGQGPSLARKLMWLFASFLPSSLLLGVTTHITTNVAAIPLFWVIPLALYLLAFIIAFKRKSWFHYESLAYYLPLILLPLAPFTFYELRAAPVWTILLHLLLLFVVCLLCDCKLSALRPQPKYLTEFYLWISLGGALGGIFNSIIAPACFSGLFEYPLVVALAFFIRCDGPSLSKRDLKSAMVLSISALLVCFGFSSVFGAVKPLKVLLNYGLPVLIIFYFHRRAKVFAVSFLLIFAHFVYSEARSGGSIIYRSRNFFGVKSVFLDQERQLHFLKHGTTNHGSQSFIEGKRLVPLAYYHPSGPVGDIFSLFEKSNLNEQVGLIGLGVGAMACYAKSGEHFTFYELDPAVEELARGPEYFTFLSQCLGKYEVVIGDGRLTLNSAADGKYTLLVVDVFSSDAVPVHLLTKEALTLYLKKLDRQGVLVFNISNLYLNFVPLLTGLANSFGLFSAYRSDLYVPPELALEGKLPSMFFAMTRSKDIYERLIRDKNWQTPENADTIVWTDRFTNLLRLVRF